MEKTPVRELTFYKIEEADGFYKVLKKIERDDEKEIVVISYFLEEREAEIFLRNYIDSIQDESREKYNKRIRERKRRLVQKEHGCFTRQRGGLRPGKKSLGILFDKS